MSDRYYVLTYGTLMKGKGNHSWMEYAQGEFIEPVITTTSEYTMISVHESFPAIVKGDAQFKGELYAVPQEGILYSLDYLEGYPNMYDRTIISCKGLNSGTEYKALVYVFTSSALHSLGNSLVEPEQSKFISFNDNCYQWN